MKAFAESEYYMLMLVDEMKQRHKDENITTCFDLFSKLLHENKRIWVNIRNGKGALVNSYFIIKEFLFDARWTYFIATDCYTRGFYDRYYIVNCMNVIEYQHWHILCKQIAETAKREREEKRKQELLEQKLQYEMSLIGKQYNMFGGLD